MVGLRRHVAIAGAVGLLGLVAACGGNSVDDAAVEDTASTAVESVEDVTPGGDLKVGIEIKPTTFDPMPNGSASGPGEQYAIAALYDSLTDYSELDGSIEGRLAESFESNDDFTKWTVKLREGVTFSDGEPFTADAVVANYEFRAKKENCQCAEEYSRLKATAIDDLTVEIAIDGGDAHAPANAFLDQIMSPKTLVAGYDRNNKPIGTGPFTLVDRDKMTFAKNPDYWRTDDRGRSLPFVDTMTLVPIPDGTVRLAALRKGEIDVMESTEGVTIASASEDDELAVYPGPKSGLTVGIANTAMNHPGSDGGSFYWFPTPTGSACWAA